MQGQVYRKEFIGRKTYVIIIVNSVKNRNINTYTCRQPTEGKV